jgi:putative tryptophan/tyrosine transport system substrate-binding protein
MRRRAFITLLGGAAASPLAVRAQQPGKSYRIAIIHPFTPVEALNEAASPLTWRYFFEELRRAGYVEGQNLVVERHSGVGKIGHQAELLLSVAASKPDAISTVAMEAALKNTPVAIPIVEIGLDPIAFGLASNLARPDRNITGVAMIVGNEFYAKHLELLRQAIPTASRIVCLTSRELWESGSNTFGPLREAAKQVEVALIPALLEPPYPDSEYRRVFAALAQDRPDALLVAQAVWNYAHQKVIVELANDARLPAIYPGRSFVDQGGLMSYGADLAEIFRRAGSDVAQILGGAKPGDIPYYQASRFQLIINLKTATALGLTLPQSLFARADEVIE